MQTRRFPNVPVIKVFKYLSPISADRPPLVCFIQARTLAQAESILKENDIQYRELKMSHYAQVEYKDPEKSA